MLYRALVGPALGRIDAERAHRLALATCRVAGAIPGVTGAVRRWAGTAAPSLAVRIGPLAFPHPVGLAPGLDKDALALPFLASLGFGFVEAGSISAEPSPGNTARPRLARLPADRGLKVFYGVPSEGVARVAERLRGRSLRVPLGASIVETNTGRASTVDTAIAAMVAAARPLVGTVDYLALNLQCPNTHAGAAPFDDPGAVRALLDALASLGDLPSVFVKTATGDDPVAIRALVAAAEPHAFVRAFVPNVHVRQPHADMRTPAETLRRLPGSVTGPINHPVVRAALRAWSLELDPARHRLVAVGGIATAEDAYACIRLGASLVQVYTALVYAGPALVRSMRDGLARLLARDGFASIEAARGTDRVG